jgi:predicted transposase/invertase (TIGR01784 family)
MQFLDVKTDYAFKKVFGSENSKPILLSFLNALLDFNGEVIADLTIVDPYQIPLIQGMKDSYVDVKATLSNRTQVIIEMQVLNVEGFEKRILYNAAKSYASQLAKGDDYTLLNPVIALTLTDFVMFREFNKMISQFKLLEKQYLLNYSDDIELIFIELPKFTKMESELETLMDKWLYFVKNAGSLAYIPMTLKETQEIVEAFNIANTAALSSAELDAQERRYDFVRLQRGAVQLAKKEGLEEGLKLGLKQGLQQGKQEGLQEGLEQGKQEGLQEGLQQGKQEAMEEMAKRLLQMGLDRQTVVTMTHLSEEILKRLCD